MTQVIDINERILSPGSERAILSALLNNPERIPEVEELGVFPDKYAIQANRIIHNAIVFLYTKNETIDAISIMEIINDKVAKEQIEELGGYAYINMLKEINPSENLKMFAEKILQCAVRREIYTACEKVKNEMLKNEEDEKEKIISNFEKLSLDLTMKQNVEITNVYKMGSTLGDRLNERMKCPTPVPGLSLGDEWKEWDRYTQGGKPGDLICVVAPSKTGKSTLLRNWADKYAFVQKRPVLYIDTEMQGEGEQEDRSLASLSGVPIEEIQNGMFAKDTIYGKATDKIKRIKKAKDIMDSGNFFHVYMPHFSIEKVTSLVRRMQLKEGIEALFFDYIKLPSNQTNSLRAMQEYQSLGFFTSGLKDIAGIFQIPVYTACQENRSQIGQEKKDENAIGGSYRILQLATKLVFLYNKTEKQLANEGADKGNQKLQIAFQRNGMSDCPPINIMFNKMCANMKEA